VGEGVRILRDGRAGVDDDVVEADDVDDDVDDDVVDVVDVVGSGSWTGTALTSRLCCLEGGPSSPRSRPESSQQEKMVFSS